MKILNIKCFYIQTQVMGYGDWYGWKNQYFIAGNIHTVEKGELKMVENLEVKYKRHIKLMKNF